MPPAATRDANWNTRQESRPNTDPKIVVDLFLSKFHESFYFFRLRVFFAHFASVWEGNTDQDFTTAQESKTVFHPGGQFFAAVGGDVQPNVHLQFRVWISWPLPHCENIHVASSDSRNIEVDRLPEDACRVTLSTPVTAWNRTSSSTLGRHRSADCCLFRSV